MSELRSDLSSELLARPLIRIGIFPAGKVLAWVFTYKFLFTSFFTVNYYSLFNFKGLDSFSISKMGVAHVLITISLGKT